MASSEGAALVVDDDVAIGAVLVALLEQRGLEADHVASGEDAVKALETRAYDIVLSDVRMPGMDGLELLDHVSHTYPAIPVVLLTAHGSVQLAVEAMKRGAADFVQKPFDRDEVVFVVEKALEGSRAARSAIPAPPAGDRTFVGRSVPMESVFATIRKVAPTNSTVLVRGETGTGKELVARALHANSPRKDEAFVSVNCAALSESLLESELFGHEKGAFTGASSRKAGRIELAHEGTLFLDEIGDVPKSVQVKLLRVIQERELERVGGTQTVRVDVRIVAATHRDLEAMVASGDFREDLYYRLAVVPIDVPPLRQRAEDVDALARHFILQFGGPSMKIEEAAIELLRVQSWPGNVRQLQNMIERLVVLADRSVVTRVDVERELGRTPGRSIRTPEVPKSSPPIGPTISLDANRRETERQALVQALTQTQNNRTKAARLLEVSRRTLYNKLKEHGLD